MHAHTNELDTHELDLMLGAYHLPKKHTHAHIHTNVHTYRDSPMGIYTPANSTRGSGESVTYYIYIYVCLSVCLCVCVCVCVHSHTKHTCELDKGLWRIFSRGCLWTADYGGRRRFSVPVWGPDRICACCQNAGRRGAHQLVCIGKRNRRVAEMLELARVFTSWGHFGACMYVFACACECVCVCGTIALRVSAMSRLWSRWTPMPTPLFRKSVYVGCIHTHTRKQIHKHTNACVDNVHLLRG
jgi:hypothetical protein